MIQVVINYDPGTKEYKVYEPSTNIILVTTNITEALVNLSKFLLDSGMIDIDILNSDDISYHLDSATMKAIVKSNVTLLKRLNNGPSEIMKSSQKFGQDSKVPSTSFGGKNTSFGSGKFNKSYRKFGRM